MSHANVAERLTSALMLDTPPVGLTFTNEPPAGVPVSDRVVPSSCSFWRHAENGVFYAPAEAHFNCPVGAMVMGFEMPSEVQEQLGGLVGNMAECSYLDPAEAARIPTVSPAAKGIVYGPLADLPVAPDAVLMWLTPWQAMFFNEAAGAANWTQGPPLMTGRPACAAIPNGVSGNSPSMSLGCAGMRTFTDIANDKMLAVIPGQLAESFTGALEQTRAANQTMFDFYNERKAAIG